ncbi:MAG: glycoside hydrolase 100 family protein [Janthinobacterium lividum]
MHLDIHSSLAEEAKALLRNASSGFGIKASLENKDNYNRIWARDSALSAMAIFSAGLADLYPTLKSSLSLLQNAAAANGQIPSNISLIENGKTTNISFGGPADRIDAIFWWVIAAVSYLQTTHDEDFETKVNKQRNAVFTLAKSWKFNGKGLMDVPMSSNWPDKYVTHGFVLYNQLLRYWALAGDFFKNAAWNQEAATIKAAIKQRFLPAADQVLDELELSAEKTNVIAISGESGSGKTTLGQAFRSILTQKNYRVLLLHQKDCFRLPPQQNHQEIFVAIKEMIPCI